MTGINIIEIKNFATYIYLSAVDGTFYCPPIIDYIDKPINASQQITWVCSPTGLYLTRQKSPYDTYLDSGSGITFYAATGDYFSFYSTSTAGQTYTISAISGDMAGSIYGIYTFNYIPITTEILTITPVSSTNFGVHLQLYRTINSNNTYTIDPVSAIKWGIIAVDHALPAITTAVSGATGIDIQDGVELAALTGSDLTMAYAGTYTFGNTGFPGVISAAPMMGYNCSYWHVTASRNILGIDFLKISVDPRVVTSYVVSACYAPSINSTISAAYYAFTPSFPITATSSAPISFDDSSRSYLWNIKTYNYIMGELIDLTSDVALMYNISASSPNVYTWITNTANISYTPFTLGDGSNYSNMYFYASTDTYEYGDPVPNYTLLVQVTSLSSYTLSALSGIINTQQLTHTISAFPGDTLYDPIFKINYENPRDVNGYMFRTAPSGTTFTITAYDASLILGSTSSGTRIWDFGDIPVSLTGALSATSEHPVIHTYTITDNPRTYNITMTVSGAQSTNWSGSKNKSSKDTMRFVAVDHLLSAEFVVYPTYYFDNSVITSLNSNTYTNSPGACAYGEGHVEYFNICAKELPLNNMVYNWQVGNNIFTTSVQSTSVRVPSYAGTYGIPGSAISLSLFDNTFLSSMVIAHTGDDGNPTYYPNSSINIFAYTAPSGSRLFQNIRFSQYEAPTAYIDCDPLIDITSDPTLNATIFVGEPITSPVIVNSGNYVWTLSSSSWTTYIQQTGSNFSYTLTSGNGTTPGTVGLNLMTILLLVTGVVDTEIPYLDWPQKNVNISASNFIYTVPTLNIFSPYTHTVTGHQVHFDNMTQNSVLISGFIWDSDSDFITTTYDPFYISYNTTGSKNITLSAVTTDGYVYSRYFPNIITVDTDYGGYSSEVGEAYKTTFALPYTRNDVLLPPNEWVTADNINTCFDRLNDNINYLKNIAKIYGRPPTAYYGWFGTHSVSGTQWTTVYEQGSATAYNLNTTTGVLTSVYDIVSKDNKLYITNNTSVQILSGNNTGTLIAERNYKSLDDYFVTPIALDLSSDNYIYILDATKNKVVIFTYDTGWELVGSWGGLGGAIAKNKFNYPTDLILDSSDNVWVVDYKNLVIKQYTKYGSWLQTISSPYFTDSTKPISMAIDSDNNLHVVLDQPTSENSILVFGNTGNYIKSYNGIGSGRITASNDKNFMYVVSNSSQKIAKFTKDGYFLGHFGTSTDFTGTLNYKGIYQDSDNNLYISNNNSILKFYDNTSILNFVNTSVDYIDKSNIFIAKDEYIEPWVYNRCFVQIWYNLELFARNLVGRITINDDGSYTVNYIDTISEFDVINNRVNYQNIYVGVNEFVTADVINRCLNKLYDFEQQLFNAII